MQQPNVLLAILSKMAQKPEVKFDNLFSKLYNTELWLLAYQSIAPKPGNLTTGVDGKNIDGMGNKVISQLITELKSSRYKPHPVRRVYLPKPDGRLRPIGIPSFRDKLLQTILKLILEAIYEPTFSDASHGFRPQRSCHTALSEVKKMHGTRWWVEADIKGFFDNVSHEILIAILSKRITDKRFLNLVAQFLGAGYAENWIYHKTYSGVPQGGNLSPVLSNIFLNELDQTMAKKIKEFNTGRFRRKNLEYHRITMSASYAKKRARQTGKWGKYKELCKQARQLPSRDPNDPHYRRLTYIRYADDVLLGVIGSKAEAVELKNWLETYLKDELNLELSRTKTLITPASKRIRFLGYDIKRWSGERIFRFRNKNSTITKRTGSFGLRLLVPHDKVISFAKEYGNTQTWRGTHRSKLLRLSELEILMTYNAEVRGFLGYYTLADNFTDATQRLLYLTTGSFFCTLANKRRSTFNKVLQSLKKGPNTYAVPLMKNGKAMREYFLVSSTQSFKKGALDQKSQPDQKPNTQMYRNRTELGQRLLAEQCEWCGSQGRVEVHHVRKLADLKGKEKWEQEMIQRQRKTMVLCVKCHHELHAGKLNEKKKKAKGELESQLRLTV